MAFRVLPAVALTFALLFAGCADEDPPADTPPMDGPELHASESATSTPAQEQVIATRTVEETPVHAEGTTSTGGCAYVFTPAGSQGHCEYTGGDSAFVPLEGGSPMRLAGTLTWTAATPNSQELNVYVLHLNEDGFYWFDHESPLASGASPLAFDFDLSAYNDTQVAVGVSNTQGAGTPAAYAAASTAQDFVLDAVFTTVVLRA